MEELSRWFNDERADRWAWAVLALLLAVVTTLALLPQQEVVVGTGWDKADHCLAFAALAAVALRAWAHVPAPAGRWWTVLGWLLGYGVAIELLQSQIPGRHGSGLDVAADAVGLVLGSLVYGLARRLLPWSDRARPNR